MLINAARLKIIESNFNDIYGQALLKKVPVMNSCVESFKATSYILSDIYCAQLPPLRSFEGKRKHRNVRLLDSSNAGIAVKQTKPFESTVDIMRADILADRLGVYNSAVAQAAYRTIDHLDIRASLALLNGTTTHSQYTGFDGKAIFATDHDLSGASQTNLLTASLDATGLQTALATAKSWKGNEGLPLNVGIGETPWLVVPPQLEWTARQLVEMPGIATIGAPGASSNVLYKTANVIVNPFLVEEPSAWYLLFPSNGINPIAHYSFIEPEFTIRMDPSDPIVYETDTYSFGAYTHSHTLILNWFQALKSNPSTNTYTGTTIKTDI